MKMNKPGTTGVKRIINASKYSMSGLHDCWTNEPAFRQDFMLGFALVCSSVIMGFGFWGIVSTLVSGILLVAAEAVNTAIEAVVDRTGSHKDELGRMAKDVGSSIVFLVMISVLIVFAANCYCHFFK
ncbi:diacylglycerol kinase [Photobacterium kishitanii]|uniref:Diacylglycerol kinase n=2 Tax=Photobacterium kishitanii TaxID=318456 RepID=A0A2T3KMN5_9GAMM|nr:diacylglycerol kinase [Photobacterium kishitanii]